MSRKVRNMRSRKGQALVEYALLIAGVALISAAAVSLFGHKTSDMISATAAVLPGAHADDNGPIMSGHLIETAPDSNGVISLDVAGIQSGTGTRRLSQNVTGSDALGSDLIIESNASNH